MAFCFSIALYIYDGVISILAEVNGRLGVDDDDVRDLRSDKLISNARSSDLMNFSSAAGNVNVDRR